MFIEDDELRSLYQAASDDHLNTIESGLLYLEKSPQDKTQLTSLQRALHSLKGDSRMLGVEDAETLVHQMEELLSAVEHGQQPFSADLCERLYKGLDAVRRIAREATTGDAANISIFHVMAQLMGAIDAADAAKPADRTSNEATSNGTVVKSAPLAVAPELDADHPNVLGLYPEGPQTLSRSSELPELPLSAFPESPAAIVEHHPSGEPSEVQTGTDTIRVKAQALDGLMTQADELTMAKLRIAQRVDDVAELLNFWEEWHRETSQWRPQLGQGNPDVLQQFYDLNQQRIQQLGTLLTQVHAQTAEDTARLSGVANELESGLRGLRLMPLSSIFSLFPRMVRDIAKQQQKDIHFEIEGGDILADKKVLEEIKDPLTHLLRNAIDHGIETVSERREKGKAATACLRLRGYSIGDRIGIEVVDDGRGLDLEAIYRTALRKGLHTEVEMAAMSPAQIQGLIFAAGFSTRSRVTELSGRGVGLDVVRDNIERLKGSVEVESTPNQGCNFRLVVSSNLATTHALITSVNQTPYAIPLETVATMLLVNRQDLFHLEGQPTLNWQGQPLLVAWLADLLELPVSIPNGPGAASANSALPCVILKVGKTHLGIIVDALLEQQTLVLKPQSKLLQRVRNLTGAALLGSGEICMVLNPQDLLKSVLKSSGGSTSAEQLAEVKTQSKVLLVEDSIPIRTQVKRILEAAGYDVTAAVDGLDGFSKLRSGVFAAVVSDVEMPNLTGLELTRRIRQYPEYEELPIILVTTLAKDEDKRRGADAGANAYLTKGDFDQSLLLATLRRFI
jgi:two-component system, chemotaxis family, sensor kinase CheA